MDAQEETVQNDFLGEYRKITTEHAREVNSKPRQNTKSANKNRTESYYGNKKLNVRIWKIREEWKNSVTVKYPFLRDKTDPANYRRITLLNTALRLLTKIIADDVTSIMPISHDPLPLPLFILKQLVENTITTNKLHSNAASQNCIRHSPR